MTDPLPLRAITTPPEATAVAACNCGADLDDLDKVTIGTWHLDPPTRIEVYDEVADLTISYPLGQKVTLEKILVDIAADRARQEEARRVRE